MGADGPFVAMVSGRRLFTQTAFLLPNVLMSLFFSMSLITGRIRFRYGPTGRFKEYQRVTPLADSRCPARPVPSRGALTEPSTFRQRSSVERSIFLENPTPISPCLILDSPLRNQIPAPHQHPTLDQPSIIIRQEIQALKTFPRRSIHDDRPYSWIPALLASLRGLERKLKRTPMPREGTEAFAGLYLHQAGGRSAEEVNEDLFVGIEEDKIVVRSDYVCREIDCWDICL